MLNDPRIAEQFKKAVEPLGRTFPEGLPKLSKADWKELHGLESVINEEWKSDTPSLIRVRETAGLFRIFWFSKKA